MVIKYKFILENISDKTEEVIKHMQYLNQLVKFNYDGFPGSLRGSAFAINESE
jgi:hypothetical protein